MIRRSRHPLRTTLVIGAVAVLVASVTGGFASGASSSNTVSVTVASATNLDASGCAAGVAGKTDLGSMLPSQTATSTLDCSLVFGSSNDTAMVKLFQADGFGSSMFRLPDGTLDTGFDTDGLLQIDLSGANRDDSAARVKVQGDDKIVVVGSRNNASDSDLLVARFNADGTVDASFGGGSGFAVLDLGATEIGRDLEIQPDGKIVVAGYTNMSTDNDVVVARYTSAGVLDTSFDADGYVVTDIPANSDDAAYGVALQPDGKIVVAGRTDNLANGTWDSLFMRYTASGALDTAFDSDGIQIINRFEAIEQQNQTNEVVIQSDGMIVGFGKQSVVDGEWIRLTAGGAFDARMAVGNAGNEQAFGGLIQPDGKYVSVLDGTPAAEAYSHVQRTSAGAYDATFSGDGKVEFDGATASGYEKFNDVMIAPNGELTAVGLARGASGSDLLVGRATSTGAIDTTFSSDGMWSLNMAGASVESLDGVAPASDGQIVAAGSTNAGTDVDTLIVSFSTSTFADFDDDNIGSDYNWSEGGNMFGACLQTVANGAGGGGASGWTVAGGGNCTTALNANWNPIPATSASGSAKVASTSSSTITNATANLRFGVKTSGTQPPGRYVAPVTIAVLAPNV